MLEATIPSKVLVISTSSIFGVLTRVFLNHVFGPRGASLSSRDVSILFFDLPANLLGCFILGAFSKLKTTVTVPALLVLAISTGYAGSVTTFASWNYQVLRMLVKGKWLHSAFALAFGTSLSLSAFIFGGDSMHFAIYIYNRFFAPKTQSSLHLQRTHDASTLTVSVEANGTPNNNSERLAIQSQHAQCTSNVCIITVTLSLAFALVQALTIAGAVLDSGDPDRRAYWTSASMAPLGAMLRWTLSHLNRPLPALPIGTLCANLSAMLLDCVVGAITLARAPLSQTAALVLQGVITGLAGSMSTMSTLASEALAMPRSQRYAYVVATILGAQIIGLVIYGPVYWTTAPPP